MHLALMLAVRVTNIKADDAWVGIGSKAVGTSDDLEKCDLVPRRLLAASSPMVGFLLRHSSCVPLSPLTPACDPT